jgi:hypothetical protein
MAARGCLIQVLANREDWQVTADSMWRQAQTRRGEGRDTYRKWFAEMEAAGYMTRHKVTDTGPYGGVKVQTVLHFYDTALPADHRTNAYPSKKAQVTPMTTRVGVGNPGIIKKDQERRTNTESSSLHDHDHDGTSKDLSREGSSASVGGGQDHFSAGSSSVASPGAADPFEKLGQDLARVCGAQYGARFLVPRFRQVASDLDVSGDLVEDAVACWVFFDVLDDFKRPDDLAHAGKYLHKVVPDLVQAYLDARNKKAAELGVDPETFDLNEWMNEQEEIEA